MFRFVCKRILISIFILTSIITLLFFLFELQPGNPYLNYIKPGMSPTQIEKVLLEKGYYDSIFTKWKKVSLSILSFNFGYSLKYNLPVTSLIFQRLPNTLKLTLPSLIISVFFSIIIGSRIAYYPKSIFAKTINLISSIGICTPTFFIAIFLIKIFAFDLSFFPISGMESITETHVSLFLSRLHHSILPITTLTLLQFFVFVRYVSAFMSKIKDEPFIQTYEGFGMLRYLAYKKMGFRAIRAKLATIIFMEVPNLICGALITESIFVWPGVGKLNFDAVLFRDYPLIIGITTFTAICVLLTNMISDILNYLFDKRMGL